MEVLFVCGFCFGFFFFNLKEASMDMQMCKFVRVVLLVVLLKRFADFCGVLSCINYLICGCNSVNAPNGHLA